MTSGAPDTARRILGRWTARLGPASMALGFAVAFAVSIGAGVFTDFYVGPAEAEQPIVFNHRKHVEENSMECSDCHEFYAKETYSGLPSADLCSFCHAEAVGESAEEARLVALLEEGAPLEWQPLFRQPAHDPM